MISYDWVSQLAPVQALLLCRQATLFCRLAKYLLQYCLSTQEFKSIAANFQRNLKSCWKGGEDMGGKGVTGLPVME